MLVLDSLDGKEKDGVVGFETVNFLPDTDKDYPYVKA